jgi:hemoglobin-like flavoprotein
MAVRLATAMGTAKGLSKAIGNEAAYQSLIEASNAIGEQQQALFRNILLENTNSKRKLEELEQVILSLREQIVSLGIEKENYWTLAEVINKDTIERDKRSVNQLILDVRESTTLLNYQNILKILENV